MLVSPVNFKTLAYVLEVEGHDPAPALRRCGLHTPGALDDRGPWLPVALFDEFLAAALETTGDPCFGLVAGKSKGLMRYVTLMQITLVAPTLRQVMANISRYATLFLDHAELELCERDGLARVLVHPVVAQGCSGRFRTEWVATSAIQMLRFAQLADDDIHAVDLPVLRPQAAYADRYDTTVWPRLQFDRPRGAIEFDGRTLDRPLPTHDPVAYAGALAAAESALAAQRSGSNLAERVRRILLASFPQQPKLDDVATQLRLNERSLRRQLAALGFSYAAIEQQCAQVAATRLLANRALPIKSVADSMGFSCVASFHRAFKRWTRMTPVEWRARQGHPH